MCVCVCVCVCVCECVGVGVCGVHIRSSKCTIMNPSLHKYDPPLQVVLVTQRGVLLVINT